MNQWANGGKLQKTTLTNTNFAVDGVQYSIPYYNIK